MPLASAPADVPAIADTLLVIDVQDGLVSGPGAVPGHARLLSAIDSLLTRARAAGAPVVFVQNDGAPGAVDAPFQPGWALHLPPRAGEQVLRKHEDDAFEQTRLDDILAALGSRNLAVCGVLSEMCVAATARAALARGYGVCLAHDAHATYDVPPGPGSVGVPAAMAARVAEWSLGDEVRICASAHEVGFIAPDRGERRSTMQADTRIEQS